MKVVTADAMVWFPMLEAGHRGRFVVTPRKFNADEVVEPIDPCVIRGKKIGFPLTEGVKLAESLGYSVQCAHPETKRVKFAKCPDPSHPSAPPNQAEFFEAVKCAVIENYAACAQAQTGSGKTVTALYVAAKLQTTILAIVPSRSLAQQWLEEAVTHLGLLPSEVGIVQAGVFPPGKKFVAAVIHNVIDADMPKGYAEQFGFVVWDECLPAGTLVDGKAIETVKVGDHVLSMSDSGKLERKRVTYTWKRPLGNKRLCRVTMTDGTTVVCTEEHLFWTEHGYTAAKDLHPGVATAKVQYADTSRHNKTVQSLREASNRQHKKGKAGVLQERHILLSRTRRAVQERSLEAGNATNAPPLYAADKGAHEDKEPYAVRRGKGQSVRHAKGYGAQTENQGRQRHGADCSAEGAVSATAEAVACGVRGRDRERRGESGIPFTLQTRPSKSCEKNSGGDRWLFARGANQEGAGLEKGCVLEVSRVESVEVIERGSSGGYPEDCPEGFVYDLEVEDNHNFFANGILVHNCHRLGAREFNKSLAVFPAKYKLALTATAGRADGCWTLVENYFGAVCCLAENDSMETHVYPIYSDFPLPGWATELEVASWIKWLTNLSPRNKIIADTAKELYRQGRKLVIMSDSVRHLHTLQKELIARGIPEKEIAFYTGFIYAKGYEKLKKPKKISIAPSAHAVIRSSNKLRVVLGTYAQMKEAVNIPWLDAGIDATPKADGIQMVGRIRRRRPGKKIPCWFTIVDRHIPRLFAFAKARMRGLASVGITINDFNYE